MPILERADISGPPPVPGGPGVLVPVEYSREIIKGATEGSFCLRNFRTQRMPAGIVAMPVIAALPSAGWVTETPLTGTGREATMKPTTEPGYTQAVLRAEEAAAIVVVPEAVVYDASVDLMAELRPLLTEALARVVDEAILFGGSGTHVKPASWDQGIVTQAVADGPVEAGDDFTASVGEAMGALEAVGYDPTLVGGGPGLAGMLRTITDTTGRPIYFDNVRDASTPTRVWGVPVDVVRNGAWDDEVAVAAVFDTQKIVVGVREDITFKVLTEATIDVSTARDGSALVYLAQQDCVALRVKYRVAWTSVQPVGPLGNRVPAVAITPATP